jgi:hypothetical protein
MSLSEIAKPLPHICNLSFTTAKFPRKIEIAKKIAVQNLRRTALQK